MQDVQEQASAPDVTNCRDIALLRIRYQFIRWFRSLSPRCFLCRSLGRRRDPAQIPMDRRAQRRATSHIEGASLLPIHHRLSSLQPKIRA